MQVFSVPVEQFVEPVVEKKTISKLEFISLFRDDEYYGLLSSIKTDPRIEIWYEKFKLLEEINLDDRFILDGLNILKNKQIVSESRAESIKNKQPPPPGPITQTREDGVYFWDPRSDVWVKAVMPSSNT